VFPACNNKAGMVKLSSLERNVGTVPVFPETRNEMK